MNTATIMDLTPYDEPKLGKDKKLWIALGRPARRILNRRYLRRGYVMAQI